LGTGGQNRAAISSNHDPLPVPRHTVEVGGRACGVGRPFVSIGARHNSTVITYRYKLVSVPQQVSIPPIPRRENITTRPRYAINARKDITEKPITNGSEEIAVPYHVSKIKIQIRLRRILSRPRNAVWACLIQSGIDRILVN
jgi:hypothetical protein